MSDSSEFRTVHSAAVPPLSDYFARRVQPRLDTGAFIVKAILATQNSVA